VEKFINPVPGEEKRKDAFEILEMMKQVSKLEPKMWGPSIIGFGNVHLKYESGRELDWFQFGFSPRKQNLTIYLGLALEGLKEEFRKLGKYKTGKGCLYINKLSDIDKNVFRSMIKKAATKKSK